MRVVPFWTPTLPPDARTGSTTDIRSNLARLLNAVGELDVPPPTCAPIYAGRRPSFSFAIGPAFDPGITIDFDREHLYISGVPGDR